MEPLVISWGYESDKPSRSRFIDEQEWTGTRDIAAYLTTSQAIAFCAEHDWDAVRLQCHALAASARERITAFTGLPPLSPDSPEWYMQMVTVPLPPCDAEECKAKLYDEFRIEVPIVQWQSKPYIRISIQAYNNGDDIDRLLEALVSLFRA